MPDNTNRAPQCPNGEVNSFLPLGDKHWEKVRNGLTPERKALWDKLAEDYAACFDKDEA